MKTINEKAGNPSDEFQITNRGMSNFLNLVDISLVTRSGSIFYSGQSAFLEETDLYILGLNPGGSPLEQATETIQADMQLSRSMRNEWSAYQDDAWQGKEPGSHGMQPRVLYLLKKMGRDPRKTPSSNVVFVRTNREADLVAEKEALLTTCWRVHAKVIDTLRIKTIICFGGTAGLWVREKLNAHDLIGTFIENNNRRWTNRAHCNAFGQCVITLTHPSIVDWTATATDPSSFVISMMTSPRADVNRFT